jgi:hypothetical protein
MLVSVPAFSAETVDKEIGGWIEAQAVSGDKPSKVIGWYEHEIKDSFGFYVLVEKESADHYRQFYVGPTFKPFPWLQIGAGIGREADTTLNSVRRNVFFDATVGKLNVFGTFENGGSGFWNKVTATYAVTERYGVGVMHETLLGSGLRAEFNTKVEDKKTQLWAAALEQSGKKTLVLGINVSF